MTQVLSYSQFQTFGLCPRKWMLSRKYEPKRKANALREGELFHLVLGKYYGAKSLEMGREVISRWMDTIPPDEINADTPLREKIEALKAVVAVYHEQVFLRDNDEFEVLATEEPFKIDLGSGLVLMGYMDGIWKHKKSGVRFIVEHKYKSDFQEELLPLDLQVSLYTIGALPKYGLLPTLYNVARKPMFRKKATEDGGTFLDRIHKLVREESKTFTWSATDFESRFFVRRAYSRGSRELPIIVQQIKAMAEAMDRLEKDPSKVWRNVGDHCMYFCPFKSICLDDEDELLIDQFFIRKAESKRVVTV